LLLHIIELMAETKFKVKSQKSIAKAGTFRRVRDVQHAEAARRARQKNETMGNSTCMRRTK
jgi:hypothetical protein